MRLFWVSFFLMLLLVGCGSDEPEQSYEELFDLAVARYCGEPPDGWCRADLADLMEQHNPELDFTKEELLTQMLELDPDEHQDLILAWLEASRQLIFEK